MRGPSIHKVLEHQTSQFRLGLRVLGEENKYGLKVALRSVWQFVIAQRVKDATIQIKQHPLIDNVQLVHPCSKHSRSHQPEDAIVWGVSSCRVGGYHMRLPRRGRRDVCESKLPVPCVV